MQANVHLEDIPLWQRFDRLTNEMIVTKGGRRMFPVVRVTLTDLDPRALYAVSLEMKPADGHRWKYMNGEWMTTGKAENTKIKGSSYVHPESPNFGLHWTKDTVSFSKVKLTNSVSGKNNLEQLHINSLHKYEPLVRLERLGSTGSELVATRQCPEARFIAVTAYQNDEITGLKIMYNPFAKAFQDQKETKSCRNLEINNKSSSAVGSDDKSHLAWLPPTQFLQSTASPAIRPQVTSKTPRHMPYTRGQDNCSPHESTGYSHYDMNAFAAALVVHQAGHAPSPPQNTPSCQTSPTSVYNNHQQQQHQLQQPAYFHAYQPYHQAHDARHDARHDTRHDARHSNWWPGSRLSHRPPSTGHDLSPMYYPASVESTQTPVSTKLPGCIYVASGSLVPASGFAEMLPVSNKLSGINWTQLTPP